MYALHFVAISKKTQEFYYTILHFFHTGVNGNIIKYAIY